MTFEKIIESGGERIYIYKVQGRIVKVRVTVNHFPSRVAMENLEKLELKLKRKIAK